MHDLPNPITPPTPHHRWVPRSFWHVPDSMLAGAGAGFVSSILMCPLDVIKTKLQAQVHAHGTTGYLGAIGTVKDVFRNDGLRGLYRGLGPTLLGYLPTWAIYFTVYDGFKSRVGGEGYDGHRGGGTPLLRNGWTLHILAAMTAGATGTIVTNPLWVIKTRFMTQPRTEVRYRSTLDAFYTISRTEGLRAFYSGLAPSLLGVFHVAVQFPLYERLKEWQVQQTSLDPLPASRLLLCSALSKAVASIATYPHEVIRTRLQVQRRPPRAPRPPREPSKFWRFVPFLGRRRRPPLPQPSPASPSSTSSSPASSSSSPAPKLNGAQSAPEYRGIVSTAVKIVRDEGLRGLYKGLVVNLMRTVPNSIVTLLSYELVMRSLQSMHER